MQDFSLCQICVSVSEVRGKLSSQTPVPQHFHRFRSVQWFHCGDINNKTFTALHNSAYLYGTTGNFHQVFITLHYFKVSDTKSCVKSVSGTVSENFQKLLKSKTIIAYPPFLINENRTLCRSQPTKRPIPVMSYSPILPATAESARSFASIETSVYMSMVVL